MSGSTRAPVPRRLVAASHARQRGWAARRATMLACLALAAGAACDGGDPLSPITPADVTGTYVIVSIDGVGPPIPFIGTSTIIADTTTFDADRTWRKVEVNGVRGGGMTPTRVARYTGTWRLDAGQRTLYWQSTTMSELAFEVRDQGRVLTYKPSTGPMMGSVWRYERIR